MLLCPICQSPLTLTNKQWACVNRHSFDIAKEGYVNLLAVQHKRSKNPGDNADMIQARQQFMHGGHYQFLADAICAQLGEVNANNLLDLGCGEGYFTEAMFASLKPAQLFAIDISKAAVRLAAKRQPAINYLVASNHRIPLPEQSVDVAVRVMAPSQLSELQRLIKPGGHLLIVRPGARHLYQLKQQIYQDVRLHEEQADELEGFQLLGQRKVSAELTLDQAAMGQLASMTPFAWRKTDKLKEALQSKTSFEMSAAFVLDWYQRD